MLVAHSGVVQNFQVAEVLSQLMPVLDGCDVLEEVGHFLSQREDIITC